MGTNKKFKVITYSIPKLQLKLIEEIIEDGWVVSRSELIRKALDSFIYKRLRLIFNEELDNLDTDVFTNNEKLLPNILEKDNKLNSIFGNPQSEYKDHIYELRYNDGFKPRWVCIGKRDEFEFNAS